MISGEECPWCARVVAKVVIVSSLETVGAQTRAYPSRFASDMKNKFLLPQMDAEKR